MMKLTPAPIYAVLQFLSERQKEVFDLLTEDEKQTFQTQFYRRLGSTLHGVTPNEQQFIQFTDCEIWSLMDDEALPGEMVDSYPLKSIKDCIHYWRYSNASLLSLIETMELQAMSNKPRNVTEPDQIQNKLLALRNGADLTCMKDLFGCNESEYRSLRRRVEDYRELRRRELSETEDTALYWEWKNKGSRSDLEYLLQLVDKTSYALSIIYPLVGDWIQAEIKVGLKNSA